MNLVVQKLTEINEALDKFKRKEMTVDEVQAFVSLTNAAHKWANMALQAYAIESKNKNSGIKNPNTTTTKGYVPRIQKENTPITWGSKQGALGLLKKMFVGYGVDKTVIPYWYIDKEDEMVEDMRQEGYLIEYYYTDRENKNEEIACDGYVVLVGRV